MANMAQLTRRQSSRELGRQRSYDRMELRELHGRLLSNESAPGGHSSSGYGALNPAFKEESSSMVSWSKVNYAKHPYVFTYGKVKRVTSREIRYLFPQVQFNQLLLVISPESVVLSCISARLTFAFLYLVSPVSSILYLPFISSNYSNFR